MLKELMQNQPVTQNVSPQNFNQILNEELISLINEKCGINFSQNQELITLFETEKILDVLQDAYNKILNNQTINLDTKIFIVNSIMARVLNLWWTSASRELFFAKIQQKFTPAQIVAGIAFYCNDFERQKAVMKFFTQYIEGQKRSQRK